MNLWKKLLDKFRPKGIWIVYRTDPYVGDFFQAAFYDKSEAEKFIEWSVKGELKDDAARKKFLKESGYDYDDDPEPDPVYYVEYYDITLAGWVKRKDEREHNRQTDYS